MQMSDDAAAYGRRRGRQVPQVGNSRKQVRKPNLTVKYYFMTYGDYSK